MGYSVNNNLSSYKAIHQLVSKSTGASYMEILAVSHPFPDRLLNGVKSNVCLIKLAIVIMTKELACPEKNFFAARIPVLTGDLLFFGSLHRNQ